MQTIEEINKRYSALAEESCCLSCGSAIGFSNPQPGESCIDLGCGRGNDAIRMAQTVGEHGHVYGMDISDGMLEKAKKNAEKLGIPNVSFIKTNLETLPLPDKHVHLVISNCTINHADNKQAVWNEVHRVLKGGGRFVVSDIYALQEVPEEFRTDPEAVSECWAGAVTREAYMQTLHQAGFQDISVLEESQPYQKGKIEVASFTIMGRKASCGCTKG